MIETQRLAAQLDVLCLGLGATLEKIEGEAPLLLSLPATLHANKVLYGGDTRQRSAAAREVLDCATKERGSAGLDERTSRYVRAMLGLNGAHKSFKARMEDLVADVDNDYHVKRDTWRRDSAELMAQLAAKLVLLATYPCDPSERKVAVRRIRAHLDFLRATDYAHFDDSEMDEVYEELFGDLVNAAAFFDRHDPNLSLERRLSIIVAAVAARPYRQLYEELRPRSIDLLVPPQEVWKVFEGRPSLFDAESPEVERTMQLIERIILDIEERDDWERTLLATATAEEEGGLTQAQTLRLRAVFERLADQS